MTQHSQSALTDEQVKEAIEQMKVQCDIAQADHYRMLSARSCLYELGYSREDTDRVLTYLYEKGFRYCFDSHFMSPTGIPGDDTLEFPQTEVCYWGPDQLKSRLNSYAR